MKGFTGNSVVLIGGNIFSTETVTEATTLLTSVDYDSQIGDRVVIPAGTEVQVIVPRETNPDYVRITARLDTEDELGKEVGGIIIASAIGNPTWIPLVAAFSWACAPNLTQYDIPAYSFAYATYDGIKVNSIVYPFSQTYTVAIQADYDAMILEVDNILQGIDPDYVVMFANFGLQTLGIFADPALGIALESGVNSQALSEYMYTWIEVTNESTGGYDTITWNIDGNIFTGSSAANDFIDPTGNYAVGRFNKFWAQPLPVSGLYPTTLTVELGAASDSTSDTIGGCV